MTHSGEAPMTRREARGRRPTPATRRALARKAVALTPSRRRHSGSVFVSFTAILAVAGLVVALSVPASLLAVDGATLAATSTSTDNATVIAPVQHVAVDDDVALVTPTRDTFGTTSYAEQLRLQFANYGGAFAATTGSIRWPFPTTVTITDGFGIRPGGPGQTMHNGIDFTPGDGTPIYAIADGVVSLHVEENGGLGNHVIIQHDIPGQNVESVYAHMQYGSCALQVGDPVKVGDFLGLVGNTGSSYGSHLHFELHIDKVPVDPFDWLQANATN